LLADEPSASLDDDHALHMLALLLTTAEREGCTLIVASHDGRVIEALGEREDVSTLVLPTRSIDGLAGEGSSDRTTFWSSGVTR
jgi:putative ABC transport system ATP-binding protein